MPRKLQHATRTNAGRWEWPAQPRLGLPVEFVARALAVHFEAPPTSLRANLGGEHVRTCALELIALRVHTPGEEHHVPHDWMRAWADWLTEKGIFPAEAIEQSPEL